MDESKPIEVRASDSEREELTHLLREACVEGRLTLEEFSERVAEAMAARTREQLQALTRDLPPVQPARATSSQLKSPSSILALCGTAHRKGRWRLAQESRILVCCGECKLDLRGATISSQVTTMEVRVIAGSVSIILPEGVDVDLDVSVIAGERKIRLTEENLPFDAPVIRITGLVLAGSIDVRDQPTMSERIRARLQGLPD
ncbi:MAG TPA: DUF1707 domain-containing protein [Chloroflexota bacterium]|nr:DUF1707 domain-containing protein [Chloroflexota bacterium]